MSEYECQRWMVDAPLTAVAVDRGGMLAAFAGGDGVVRLAALHGHEKELRARPLSNGAILALAPDCQAGAFLAGSDDGAAHVISPDCNTGLVQLDLAWPDQLATSSTGLRAVADGRHVRLFNAGGEPVGFLEAHASTIAGMAFDRSGAHLAVSHYDGASIWNVSTRTRTHALQHRGSHLNLTWQPDGRFLVTATQEKMLHAWDLQAGVDISLGPFFNKVKTLGWSADGNWLLASGSDTISAWSFANGALPSPAPKMLGRFSENLIGQVCPHPRLALTAVGYNDGGLELAAISTKPSRHQLVAPSAAPVVAMAWSPDGDHLVGGDQHGQLIAYHFDGAWLARLT